MDGRSSMHNLSKNARRSRLSVAARDGRGGNEPRSYIDLSVSTLACGSEQIGVGASVGEREDEFAYMPRRATCGSSGRRRSRTSSRWAGGERCGGDLSLSNPRIPNRQIIGVVIYYVSNRLRRRSKSHGQCHKVEFSCSLQGA